MIRYLLLFFLLVPMIAPAQDRFEKLVKERQGLHQQWKDSEKDKSGIFGNRTKKDMIKTNEWMERIILKDNLIMDELEMLKNIETTEIKYEKDDYKYIAQKQEQDIGKLKRALDNKDEEIADVAASKRTYEWTTLIFFLTTLAAGYLFYRTKRQV
ncbi:Clp protease ClpB [Echinicola strongylocentroti]|uniref:Clp protease ClpB n=1 Tax=Echinicola strongylocentroti TaxID=1795355 RepID=A0A2Z4IIK5_9BACT|nr:Clp protease ClpB [Echinicola strongylocentroti]AWW30386.1 Clp protease ClpB [Echinicola strongylocentroti]